MYKTIFNKRNSLKFNRFSNKSYSLFAVLGREVVYPYSKFLHFRLLVLLELAGDDIWLPYL